MLGLPFEVLVPFAILSLICFLLPVIISCVIYLLLICKKGKFFENKIVNSNNGKALHSVPPNFQQSQSSHSLKESVPKGEVVSIFDQKNNENQYTHTKIKEDLKKNGRQKMPTSSSTTSKETDLILKGQISYINLADEDEKTEVNLLPTLEDNLEITNNSSDLHNAPIFKVLATGEEVNPEEASDLADFDFNQIEEEKTRYNILFHACSKQLSKIRNVAHSLINCKARLFPICKNQGSRRKVDNQFWIKRKGIKRKSTT